MAAFVISNKFLPLVRESASFLFETDLNAIDCVVDVFFSDFLLLLPCCEDGGLV